MVLGILQVRLALVFLGLREGLYLQLHQVDPGVPVHLELLQGQFDPWDLADQVALDFLNLLLDLVHLKLRGYLVDRGDPKK